MQVDSRRVHAAAPEGGEAFGTAVRLSLTVAARRVPATGFLGRRAAAAVAQLPAGRERVLLSRLVMGTGDPDAAGPPCRVGALVAWAAHLERAGRLVQAAPVYEMASDLAPGDAVLVLHSARVARKCGDRTRAEALYRRVSDLDGSGRLARLARVGRAQMAEDAEAALGRIVRACVAVGDHEAAAVALEARGSARRRRGDLAGALRDYLAAAVRFGDRLDVGRLGHELADMLIAAGEVGAARRALVETDRRGSPAQSAWARSRLHALAVTTGDQVGARRWADAPAPCLISLVPPPDGRRRNDGRSPHARTLRRFLARFAADGVASGT